MQSLSGTVLFALACCVGLSSSVSGEFSAGSSSSMSSGFGYQVSSSQTQINGDCISTVTILGNGIRKVIDFPCKNPTSVINLNKTLLVGDEYFSDTPGEIVHVTKDACVKEVFTHEGTNYTSVMVPMDEKECERVKLKILILKEQQEKLNEWYQQQQHQAQEQLQQLQQNIQNVQHQLFGGLFGNLPFGK